MWSTLPCRKQSKFVRLIRCLKMDIHLTDSTSQSEAEEKPPQQSLKGSKKALKRMPVEECTREELIVRVRQLEAHVTQLKNIIAKTEAKPGHETKNSRCFDFSRFNLRHIALKILYLGWDYNGLAVQEDTDRTIEAALFDALIKAKLIEQRTALYKLRRFLLEPLTPKSETSNYHRCGRTDKGVSAFSQVISIDVRSNLMEGPGLIVREGVTANNKPGKKVEELRYVQMLNKLLPPEIRVLAWAPVHTDFSARFNCQRRTYKYFFPKGNLNIESMMEAGRKLVGAKDFRNFCKMDVAHGVVTFVREIMSVDVRECDDREVPAYRMCELTVVGNAFLWHQIRCITAVLFLVGKGVESPQIVDDLLDVEKHPKKPQYQLASEFPLVLFDCQFENVDWIYDHESHGYNVRKLQELWGKSAVKAMMLRKMLTELESVPVEGSEERTADGFLDWLSPGWRGKTYKRLLDRQKCESLEEKMESVAKRQKISFESTEPS